MKLLYPIRIGPGSCLCYLMAGAAWLVDLLINEVVKPVLLSRNNPAHRHHFCVCLHPT